MSLQRQSNITASGKYFDMLQKLFVSPHWYTGWRAECRSSPTNGPGVGGNSPTGPNSGSDHTVSGHSSSISASTAAAAICDRKEIKDLILHHNWHHNFKILKHFHSLT